MEERNKLKLEKSSEYNSVFKGTALYICHPYKITTG